MKSYLNVGYFFVAIVMLFSVNSCSNNEEFDTETPPQAKLRSSSDFDPYAYFACDLRYDSRSNSIKDVYNEQYYSNNASAGTTKYDYTNNRYYLQINDWLNFRNEIRDENTTEDQFQFIEFDLEMEAYISNINGNISIVSFEDDVQNLCDLGIMYNGYNWYITFVGADWDTQEIGQQYYPINTPVSLNRIVKIKLTQRTNKPIVVDISGIGKFELQMPGYINPFYISVLDLKKIYSFKIEASEG